MDNWKLLYLLIIPGVLILWVIYKQIIISIRFPKQGGVLITGTSSGIGKGI
jgi:hypothetical protein